jgi:hypothetical protein
MITTRRRNATIKNPFKTAIHTLVGSGTGGAASPIYYNKTKRY